MPARLPHHAPRLILTGVLSLVACGGANSPGISASAPDAASPTPVASPSAATTPNPDVGHITVTLSDSGCTAASADQLTSGGQLVITAINETADLAGFDLYRLKDSASYEDWVAYHEAAAAEIASGGEGPGDPTTIAFGLDLMNAVAPGTQGELGAARALAGTYVLQCWRFRLAGNGSLQWTEPIEVVEGG